MSLKNEIQTWARALELYDAEDYENALQVFTKISDASKIQTNMGLIYAALGEHELAVERFVDATSLDQYLAVAYFQCGVSNFLLSRYDLAMQDFQDAYLYLRGNQFINYEQLGLNFRLYAAEVLFNQGLTQIYMGDAEAGLAVLRDASAQQQSQEHRVIDDAIADQGEGYTVFSIPVGILFRPPQKKLDNMNTKDYLGKAKLFSGDKETYQPFVGETSIAVREKEPETLQLPSGLSRSATAPSPTVPKPLEAKATISRARSANAAVAGPADAPVPAPAPAPAGIARNNTMLSVGRPTLPTRGLSIKRPDASPRNDIPLVSRPTPADVKAIQPRTTTQYYDELLDSYNDAEDEPVQTSRSAYAPSQNQQGQQQPRPNGPTRSGSRSAPASSYGSMRRRPTRKPTQSGWRPSPRMQSSYEEEEYEEEGYASGAEYDDFAFELVKIRVKVHYQDDIRGMTLAPTTPFDEFMDKIATKFNKSLRQISLRFTDEDGGRISLRDESDYDLAIETARENSKGKPEGKLEMWCVDV